MIIIGGKLKLDGREYDILRLDYHFQRDVDAKSRPCSVYYGGEITVQMESTDDVAIFRQMIHEDMPPCSGSIEIYGIDDVCIRRIVFEEAYIYAYDEKVSYGSSPMVITIGISPMRLDRRWPYANGWEKYKAPEEKYASAASAKEELTPECTVSFRRGEDYDSSFGFDWLRKPDPVLLAEVNRLLGQAYVVPNFKHYNLNLSLPAECNGESKNRNGERRKAVEVEKYGGEEPEGKLGVEPNSTNSLFNILWKDRGQI